MRTKFLTLTAILISASIWAQDPLRFEKEINAMIAGDDAINKKDVILFTGSSSIKFWKSLQQDFPNYNVLNRGFGGSEMGDLVYYVDKLIVPYKPKKVFIYEGDNDINNGKTEDEILKNSERILSRIREKLGKKTEVIFISPKPSLSRWQLKGKYESYNKKLKTWTSQNKNVTFIDVWTPMLAPDGTVMNDLFVEDGLHMNAKGYAIWARVVAPYLK